MILQNGNILQNLISILFQYLLCRGVKEVLKKRLKAYYKKQKLAQKPESFDGKQYYPYLIVLDFEATCEKDPPTDYLHEIIEFPAILIDTADNKIVKFNIFA